MPEHVGLHGRQRREGGADLGADEHPAGRLHGHLHLQRHLAPGGGHRPAAGDHGRLGLQQVHAGLDEEEVDAAFEQGRGLLLVGVAQLGEADVAERRQLRARPDRAGDVAGAPVGGVVVGDLASDAGGGHVDARGCGRRCRTRRARWEKAPNVAVSTASTPTAKKASCMPAITSGRVRASISLQPSSSAPPKSSALEVETLHVGAERPVEHDDSLAHGVEVVLPAGHRTRLGGAVPIGGRYAVGIHGAGLGSVELACPGTRIYTRTGDDGTTGLFYGGRARKDSELPVAYGTRRRSPGRHRRGPGRGARQR